MSKIIRQLALFFNEFPTVGKKTALRFCYFLAKQPKEKIENFIHLLQELKEKLKLCRFCFAPFEGEGNFCSICSDSSRDKSLLCIVEKEMDLTAIENTKQYKGLYFILGGLASSFKKENQFENLRLEELKKRIKENNFNEIIIALNPTPEGKTTSFLVESVIKESLISPFPKITHLAKGIPVGGELEYADEETLKSALEGRR